MTYQDVSTIDDLLADPMIQKVMRADGVEPAALRTLLNGVASRVAGARRSRSVRVDQDLGRRSLRRLTPFSIQSVNRAAGDECWAGLCG